jgi:hypothetical protein
VLILARLKQKDFKYELSLEESITHVILVFLKERKVSILFYSIFTIQMLIAWSGRDMDGRWWQSRHSMPCHVLGSAGIDGKW